MKKAILPDDDEMPGEFDFSRAIPNPWFVKVHGADYVRVIDKDLAAMFPDNESMNAALRSVAQAAARVPRKVSATIATAARPKKKARG
jgi:hypothetical protein